MKRSTWLLVGLAVLALGALACSDEDDPAAQLHGTWDITSVGSHHTWEPDGTWYVTFAGGGAPYDFGTYTVEGSIVTFDTDPDSPECPQTTGSYEVTFIDADTTSWELIDDECIIRGVNVPRAPWERIGAQ